MMMTMTMAMTVQARRRQGAAMLLLVLTVAMGMAVASPALAAAEEGKEGAASLDVHIPRVLWSQTEDILRLQFEHDCSEIPSITFSIEYLNFTCNEGATRMDLLLREDITNSSKCETDGQFTLICTLHKRIPHYFDRPLFHASNYSQYVVPDWERFQAKPSEPSNLEDFYSIIDESEVELWDREAFVKAQEDYEVLVVDASYSWCTKCRNSLPLTAKTARKFKKRKSKRVAVGAIDLLEVRELRSYFPIQCTDECAVLVIDTVLEHIYPVQMLPSYKEFSALIDKYTSPALKKFKNANAALSFLEKRAKQRKDRESKGQFSPPSEDAFGDIVVLGAFDDTDSDAFKQFSFWATEHKASFTSGIIKPEEGIPAKSIAVVRLLDREIEVGNTFNIQYGNITEWVALRALPPIVEFSQETQVFIDSDDRFKAHLCFDEANSANPSEFDEEEVSRVAHEMLGKAASLLRDKFVFTYAGGLGLDSCQHYGFLSKNRPAFGISRGSFDEGFERFGLLKMSITPDDIVEFCEKFLAGETELTYKSLAVDELPEVAEGDFYAVKYDCWHTIEDSIKSRDYLIVALVAPQMVLWDDYQIVIKQLRLALRGVVDVHAYNAAGNVVPRDIFGKQSREIKFLIFRNGSTEKAKLFKGTPKRSELIKWVRKNIPKVKEPENWSIIENNLEEVKVKIQELKEEKQRMQDEYLKQTDGLEPTPVTEDAGVIRYTISEGTGRLVRKGNVVSFLHKGYLSDGSIFDETINGRPMEVPVGLGHIFPCWDKAFIGMKQGGEAYFSCKSDYGYGDRGQGKIPPGETLRFWVELLDVKTNPDENAHAPQFDESKDADTPRPGAE